MSSMTRFLSTPSARRATRHALREEGDPAVHQAEGLLPRFLSTPSARRATRWLCIRAMPSLDFYPRPPRGGRQTYLGHFMVLTNFYPRPPRGGRPIKCKGVFQMTVISIHALREEGD